MSYETEAEAADQMSDSLETDESPEDDLDDGAVALKIKRSD